MGKVHHMVLLQFDPVNAAKVPALFEALGGLQQHLPGFLYFSGGPYRSPEGANLGYTHGCLMTFTDVAARDHYLIHPDHEAIKQEFLPYVQKVVAFDFEEGSM